MNYQKRHLRTVTAVTPIMPTPTTLSGYRIETDCGHTYTGVPHFAYKVGSRDICSTHDNDCACANCTSRAVAR
jgi:hypothetical protein